MEDLTATRSPSSSVGDYVKAVWEVSEVSGGAATTTEVAGRLSVSAASVSGAFGRLRELGLVGYERYRGATLTERGRVEALRLVRRHRLIETFLQEHLGYDRQEVHQEAERLEHAVSDAFTERLAAFLGHPERDPHGEPIPSADGTVEADGSFPLREARAGMRVGISRLADADGPVLDHLEERGLVPGRVLEVAEVRDLDGVVTVEDEAGRLHALGEVLARAVSVRELRPGPPA